MYGYAQKEKTRIEQRKMEIDFSSLWSWTVPLWGLFLLILFLGGVLTQPVVLEGVQSVSTVMAGGATGKKHAKIVRFADMV